MKYYVYKYVDLNNTVVYIGRTINLKERIENQHTKDHLKNFQGSIYYFECPNKTAMISFEYALINKYHPKYNKQNNHLDIQTDINEPKWELYMSTNNKSTLAPIIDITQYNISNKENNKFSTTIISGPKEILFRCKHCGAVFKTTNWLRTKGRHYSASCPCCPYSAWAE